MQTTKTLAEHLRALGETVARVEFVGRVATLLGSNPSLQYLRHVAAGRKRPSVEVCVAIERASDGVVRCERLRPDVDWLYLAQRDASLIVGHSHVRSRESGAAPSGGRRPAANSRRVG